LDVSLKEIPNSACIGFYRGRTTGGSMGDRWLFFGYDSKYLDRLGLLVEAIIGQVFLVTIVARLVTLYSRPAIQSDS
jgi:hypothetical protein